jgi:hypothetical protein
MGARENTIALLTLQCTYIPKFKISKCPIEREQQDSRQIVIDAISLSVIAVIGRKNWCRYDEGASVDQTRTT